MLFEKCFRLLRSKKEVDNLLDDYEDIFYNNMLDYYRCRIIVKNILLLILCMV